MSDLEYINQCLFTSFIANTKAGEDAWRQIAESTEGTCKVFTNHLPSILAQLRKAGYTVSKARKISNTEIDSIMDELGL